MCPPQDGAGEGGGVTEANEFESEKEDTKDFALWKVQSPPLPAPPLQLSPLLDPGDDRLVSSSMYAKNVMTLNTADLRRFCHVRRSFTKPIETELRGGYEGSIPAVCSTCYLRDPFYDSSQSTS